MTKQNKKYKSLYDKYKIIYTKYTQQKAQIENTSFDKAKYDEILKNNEELKLQVVKQEEQINAFNESIKSNEQSREDNKAVIKELNTKVAKQLEQLEQHKNKEEFSQRIIEKLKKEQAKTKEDLEQTTTHLDEIMTAYEQLKKQQPVEEKDGSFENELQKALQIKQKMMVLFKSEHQRSIETMEMEHKEKLGQKDIALQQAIKTKDAEIANQEADWKTQLEDYKKKVANMQQLNLSTKQDLIAEQTKNQKLSQSHKKLENQCQTLQSQLEVALNDGESTETIAELERKCESLQKKYEELKAESSQRPPANNENEEQKELVASLTNEVNSLTLKLEEISQQKEKIQNEKTELQKKNTVLQQQLESTKQSAEQADETNKSENQTKEINNLSKQLEESQNKIDSLQEQIKELNHQNNIQKDKEETHNNKQSQEKESLSSTTTALKDSNLHDNLKKQLEDALKEIDSLKQLNTLTDDNYKRLKDENLQLQEASQKLKTNDETDVMAELKVLSSKYNQLQQAQDSIQKEKDTLLDENAQLEARLRRLSETASNKTDLDQKDRALAKLKKEYNALTKAYKILESSSSMPNEEKANLEKEVMILNHYNKQLNQELDNLKIKTREHMDRLQDEQDQNEQAYESLTRRHGEVCSRLRELEKNIPQSDRLTEMMFAKQKQLLDDANSQLTVLRDQLALERSSHQEKVKKAANRLVARYKDRIAALEKQQHAPSSSLQKDYDKLSSAYDKLRSQYSLVKNNNKKDLSPIQSIQQIVSKDLVLDQQLKEQSHHLNALLKEFKDEGGSSKPISSTTAFRKRLQRSLNARQHRRAHDDSLI